MSKLSFKEIHNQKNGKASDKWESYLDYYETLFHNVRDNAISLLEIGIQNGGSLDTYTQYFKNAHVLIGCDINPNCSLLSYEDKKVHVVVGDANNKETYQKIMGITNEFDIIIDDGSHVSVDILNSFMSYFQHLKPGGIYVIEDTHTLYSKNFGGGLLNEFSAYNFFKKLVDVVNYEWWSSQVDLEEYLSTFFLRGVPAFITEGTIDSVEFKNSIITIRKSKTLGHQKLGQRLVRGSQYLVVDLQSQA